MDRPIDRRYTRQARLVEVGAAGQARLESSEVALTTDGEAATIERLYLEAAGATVRGRGPSTHTSPLTLADPAARDMALGAHAALATLRRIWVQGG